MLPAALPGILTGIILALSRRSARPPHLIIVGAVAYVRFVPDSLWSPFTVLPIQIFNWVSRPQAGFAANAAAGILVLLVMLLLMNGAAILSAIAIRDGGLHERAEIAADEVNFYYGTKRALHDIRVAIRPHVVTAFIGPSGAVRRSQDAEPDERPHPGYAARGSIKIDGQDIYAASVDVVALRRRVGMVFQSPTRSQSRFRNRCGEINRIATAAPICRIASRRA